MKIITLIENLVTKAGLEAEHGLSFYIQTERKKILFDTGQSPAFIRNANALGVDISDIDMVVISHGHYDHTGGLYQFLKLNTKARVYIKEEAFWQKFHGTKKFIGTLYDIDLLSDRIIIANEITEIDTGIFIIPSIPIVNSTDTAFYNFMILKDHEFVSDDFQDELFIAMVKNNKLSIISSCSHRGITNMVEISRKYLPKSPLNMILGGFHLKDGNSNQFDSIVSYFNDCNPESIGTCHCTGVESFAKLYNACTSRVFYNATGNQINL